MLSSLTGRLNEIFEFTLEAEPGAADLMTLRDLAEFDVRNRLLAVPGVAAVEQSRRLSAPVPDAARSRPHVRRAASRSMTVLHAAEGANINVAGGVVRRAGPDRVDGARRRPRRAAIEELRATVVAVRGGTPVLLGDIADVREAPALRRGIAHRLAGRGRELPGDQAVRRRHREGGGGHPRAPSVRSSAGCPPGVEAARGVRPVRSWSQSALGGVGRAVLLGAVFVVLVIFLLLGDLRAALLVTATIPLSVALAGLPLRRPAWASTR